MQHDFYTQVSQSHMEKLFDLFSTVKKKDLVAEQAGFHKHHKYSTHLIDLRRQAKQPQHRPQEAYNHQLVEQLQEFWDDYKEDLNIPQHRPALSLAATQLLQVHRDHQRNAPWRKNVPNPNC